MIRPNFLTDAAAAQKYVDGVKRLKDPTQFPWPGQAGLSMYDVLVFWHHQSMMLMTPPSQSDRNAAHSGPAFLPWHRYFLITLEGFLQQAVNDTTFRIPYWDWNADAELPNPNTSPIWDNTNLGQFIGPGWQVRLAMNPTTGDLEVVNRQLQRALGAEGALPTRDQVRTVVRDQAIYDMSFNSSPPGGSAIPSKAGSERLAFITTSMFGLVETCSGRRPRTTRPSSSITATWTAFGLPGKRSNPAASYVPDMTASSALQFHRIDDALHSIFEEMVTPRDMLDYKTYYEYDTLADLVEP